MDKLSKDELYVLALHLDLPDLLRLCKIHSKFYRKICNDDTVWRRKIERDFSNVKLEDLIPEIREKSYKEIYTLLYFHKVSHMERKAKRQINEMYLKNEVEMWVNEDTFIPEHLYLPNMEYLYLYLKNKNHITIPDNVRFPKLERIIVFPDDDGYYDIDAPEKYRKLISISTND